MLVTFFPRSERRFSIWLAELDKLSKNKLVSKLRKETDKENSDLIKTMIYSNTPYLVQGMMSFPDLYSGSLPLKWFATAPKTMLFI